MAVFASLADQPLARERASNYRGKGGGISIPCPRGWFAWAKRLGASVHADAPPPLQGFHFRLHPLRSRSIAVTAAVARRALLIQVFTVLFLSAVIGTACPHARAAAPQKTDKMTRINLLAEPIYGRWLGSVRLRAWLAQRALYMYKSVREFFDDDWHLGDQRIAHPVPFQKIRREI